MDILAKGIGDADVLALFSLYDDFMVGFLGEGCRVYTRYSPDEGLEAVWAAYQEGDPVGCAAYRGRGRGVGEVKRLFVKEGHRGKGTARKLLGAVERYAQERGCHTLFLDTRVTLGPAVSLYGSAGFRVVFQEGLYIQMEKGISSTRGNFLGKKEGEQA